MTIGKLIFRERPRKLGRRHPLDPDGREVHAAGGGDARGIDLADEPLTLIF
jgi:hypothetical protein